MIVPLYGHDGCPHKSKTQVATNPVDRFPIGNISLLAEHAHKSLVECRCCLPIPPVVDITSGVNVACSRYRYPGDRE